LKLGILFSWECEYVQCAPNWWFCFALVQSLLNCHHHHHPVGFLKDAFLCHHIDLHPVAVQPRMYFKCWRFPDIICVSSCCSAKDSQLKYI
jgi:hypothetical protein